MSWNDKMKVEAKPMDQYGGKHWVEVRFSYGDGRWIPSFQDLFRIIQAICHCEDEKYPPPAEGRGFVRRFLVDACQEHNGEGVQGLWEQLRTKYKIPDRSNVEAEE